MGFSLDIFSVAYNIYNNNCHFRNYYCRISKSVFRIIAKPIRLCYSINMYTYHETTLTCNQINLSLSSERDIREREIHLYHEILYYMGDDTELLTAYGKRKLTQNSLLIIPKETYHFLRILPGSNCSRLKISIPAHFSENAPLSRVMNELKIMDSKDARIQYILDRLLHILTKITPDSGFYAYSAVMMLITELDIANTGNQVGKDSGSNPLMYLIAEYIADHLSEDLSIESLAKYFHTSASTITHAFKRKFGISIHKYITQTRMVFAGKMILEGKHPNEIALEVGFKDYSAFYKSYVSFWGYSPSKKT